MSSVPPHLSRVQEQRPERGEASVRFRRSHAAAIAILSVALLTLLALDLWIISTRRRYESEIVRLRASMSHLERRRMDEIVSQEQSKLRLAIELIQRQARLEPALHLAVTVDSGVMYLGREGSVLREMPVELGPERRVGIPPDTVRLAAPLGVRTIAHVVAQGDAWVVPDWVYADRGVAVPADRNLPGGLGPAAIMLDGGTIIYARPSVGPLNDSAYVLPGAVRARAEDLQAILPNLSAGVRVYFY